MPRFFTAAGLQIVMGGQSPRSNQAKAKSANQAVFLCTNPVRSGGLFAPLWLQKEAQFENHSLLD